MTKLNLPLKAEYGIETYMIIDAKDDFLAGGLSEQIVQSLVDAVNASDPFDYMRVREWAKSETRKPANLAFTAGTNRNVAYLIEEMYAVNGAGWQPMSEYKTSDGRVLVYCADSERMRVAEIMYHMDDGNTKWVSENFMHEGDRVSVICNPTMWQKLPAAPKGV